MFRDIERYLEFIIKNKLTQAQFLFLYLIHKKKYDCIREYMKAFPSDDGSMIGNMSKQDLVHRGFIEKVGEAELATDYKITTKFTDIFLQDIHNATDELFEAYPSWIKIQGNNASLLNVDRYKLALIYAERIDYSVEEHRQVIKDVNYGRENNLIRVKLDDFVRSEQWQSIRPYRTSKEKVTEIKEANETF